MEDSQYTQNIQMNEVIGENEKHILYFTEKTKRAFWLAQYFPASSLGRPHPHTRLLSLVICGVSRCISRQLPPPCPRRPLLLALGAGRPEAAGWPLLLSELPLLPTSPVGVSAPCFPPSFFLVINT